MGEFFKPWRRKIGVVTLVMACMFAAGWVRSEMIGDRFYLLSHWRNIICEAESFRGTIEWSLMSSSSDVIEFQKNEIHWQTVTLDVFDEKEMFVFQSDDVGSISSREMTTPYWWFVTPLIALSAYLLLSKSRVAKPPEST